MNLKTIVYFLLIISCTVVGGKTFGQQPDLPREKVHLHLDKSFYSAGDTLWFKAYTVTAGNNEPSVTSKILHVDLKTALRY